MLLDAIAASPTGKAIVDESNGRRRLVFLWKVLERSSLDAMGPLFDAIILSGFIEEASLVPPATPQTEPATKTQDEKAHDDTPADPR